MPCQHKTLLHLICQQGLGSRSTARKWIKQGLVFHCPEQNNIDIAGKYYDIYPYPLHIALNKPEGFECSQKPSHHPSIFQLLPERMIRMGIQCIGRLDVETRGLLLLSTDGKWIHRLTSPKQHVQKIYRVGLKHPVDQDWCQHTLGQGVYLRDVPEKKTLADHVTWIDQKTIELSLHEGRYHQVRRMVAAVGNRVEYLERVQIGHLRIGDIQDPWQMILPSEV